MGAPPSLAGAVDGEMSTSQRIESPQIIALAGNPAGKRSSRRELAGRAGRGDQVGPTLRGQAQGLFTPPARDFGMVPGQQHRRNRAVRDRRRRPALRDGCKCGQSSKPSEKLSCWCDCASPSTPSCSRATASSRASAGSRRRTARNRPGSVPASTWAIEHALVDALVAPHSSTPRALRKLADQGLIQDRPGVKWMTSAGAALSPSRRPAHVPAAQPASPCRARRRKGGHQRGGRYRRQSPAAARAARPPAGFRTPGA